MKQKKSFIMGVMAVGFSFLIFHACRKTADIDRELFSKAKETAGFVWYKKSDALLNKSGGSGHSQPFLRTRFNSTAAQQLDDNGKIKADAVFEEGSLIVKELYGRDKKIDLYAILYKDSKNPNADSKGWVWGYVTPKGRARTSATEKGSGCNGCHSQSGNIDYMLMNKAFP